MLEAWIDIRSGNLSSKCNGSRRGLGSREAKVHKQDFEIQGPRTRAGSIRGSISDLRRDSGLSRRDLLCLEFGSWVGDASRPGTELPSPVSLQENLHSLPMNNPNFDGPHPLDDCGDDGRRIWLAQCYPESISPYLGRTEAMLLMPLVNCIDRLGWYIGPVMEIWIDEKRPQTPTAIGCDPGGEKHPNPYSSSPSHSLAQRLISRMSGNDLTF